MFFAGPLISEHATLNNYNKNDQIRVALAYCEFRTYNGKNTQTTKYKK